MQILALMKTRLAENIFLTEVLLNIAYFVNVACVYPFSKKKAFFMLCAIHRTTRRESLRLRIEPFVRELKSFTYGSFPSAESVKHVKECIGVRIICLKAPSGSEKGVLYVKFSETSLLVRDGMDVPALMKSYILIFEPSWSGYCDPDFLYYTQYEDPIFMLAAEEGDFAFLRRMNTNIVPVPLGPCDWVNPGISERYLNNKKQYDIVMNSNWGPAKRHYLLFKALQKLPDKKVALIGGAWEGRTKEDILNLAKYYNVHDQITLFERLPFERVMDIVCSSRISILLSRKEGSNRALAESIFCNVPVMLISEHVGGIRKNINEYTGWFTPENELAEQLKARLDLVDSLNPRAWALENISYRESNKRLEKAINGYFGLDQNKISLPDHSNSPELTYECDEVLRARLFEQNNTLYDYLVS